MDIHISFNDPVGFLTCAAWVIGALLVGCFGTRFLVSLNPPRSGDDRMGNGIGGLFFLALAALAFVVSFILLFFSHAGVAAVIGFGCLGVAFGLFRNT
jgi:hypothetical protein